jgi:hypothetical protein
MKILIKKNKLFIIKTIRKLMILKECLPKGLNLHMNKLRVRKKINLQNLNKNKMLIITKKLKKHSVKKNHIFLNKSSYLSAYNNILHKKNFRSVLKKQKK